jgi:uncharacterized membrane protein YbhN (UPF0104 family)
MPGRKHAGSVGAMRVRRADREAVRPPSVAVLALGAALALGLAGRIAVHAGAHLPHGAEIAALGRATVALGAPWLAVAWAVGTLAGSPRRATLSGGAGLALGTFAWYALSAAANGRPAGDYAGIATAWAAVALGAGALFALAGTAYRSGGRRARTAALALVAGTLAGEALLLASEWSSRAGRVALAIELGAAAAVLGAGRAAHRAAARAAPDRARRRRRRGRRGRRARRAAARRLAGPVAHRDTLRVGVSPPPAHEAPGLYPVPWTLRIVSAMGATALPLIRTGRSREEAGSDTHGRAPRETTMAATADTAPELALPALDVRALARRAAVPAALAAVVAVGLIVAGGPLHTFADALGRALSADPRWVAAGAAFELTSFGGYIALLWLVGARTTSRLDLRASAQITLGGAAATRLLPTGGAGGAALTLWALRRAGLGARAAARTLLAFLVLMYSVFFGAIAVAGGAIALGLVDAHGPLALSAGPAAFAALAMLAALVLAARRGADDAAAVELPDGAPRAARLRAAVRNTPGTMGGAVRDALVLLRRGDVRLLGAPAWWAFDAAVLWAMLNAFGAPPAFAVVVLGYFVGQVANTIPIPGAVSGGMVGVLLAFGVEPDLALTSVLAYRAIAIWLPTPIGLAAIGGLRRTIARWGAEDAPAAVDADAAPARVRVPEPRRPLRPAMDMAA